MSRILPEMCGATHACKTTAEAKMAEAVVGPLVGKLQELAVSEARAMVAVNDDIRSLRDRLMWLQAFLREAEPRRHVVSDELIKVWLQQTRNVAFDAEDAVDQYTLRVDLSRYPSWTRAILMFFANFTTQVRVRRDLSSKIETINTRLEDIIKNRDKYKIEDATRTSSIVIWRASNFISTTADTNLEDLRHPPLVKREEKRKELQDALFGPIEGTVIFVVGDSGLGKTTLVRDLCKQLKTKNYFDVQAMDSFAPYLSAPNIMQLILRQLTKDNTTCRREEVGDKLKDKLQDKKYLLVIDGEVSTTEWTNIQAALPNGNKSSRVVRITQEKPHDSDPSVCIELNHLDENDTRKLFLKRVRLEEKYPKDKIQEFREDIQTAYSKDMYNITRGLPLAIVLLAGLLRTKEFPNEWKDVIQHLSEKKSKSIDNIISMCFDDLPHNLKSCFLYFAALPANAMIEARDLVCMWMAEGFLGAKEGMTMEKLGYLYLKELVARNLVNIGQLDDSSSAGKKLVAIQNKVHDFLKLEAHETNFMEVYSGDDIPTFKTARRLSLPNYIDKYAALASPLPKLRSILYHLEKEVTIEDKAQESKEDPTCLCYPPHWAKSKKHVDSYIRTLLQGSEFLRVIKLQGLEIGEKLPSEIGNVVHLRYLGVTSCSLREIPSSIGKLTCLETLDVRETYVTKLPEAFWRITTLRHIFGYQLILPRRVGNLNHLQTLETIKPDNENSWDGKTLARMIRLRSLFIQELSEGNADALSIALQKLELLDILTLNGKYIPSIVFATIALRRLKFMELNGKLEHFTIKPKFIRSCLPNLLQLSLANTKVSQDFINELAELPSLANLTLYPGSYNGKQIVFSPGGFLRLKELSLDVVELNRVKICKLALPELKDLEVFIHPEKSDDLEVEIHDKPDLVKKFKSQNLDLYKKIKHDTQISNSKRED